MILKIIYMHLVGFVTIKVEGFFVERFLNICRNKKIILQDLQRENSTYITVKILKSDFKEIRHIAKNTKCKIKIERKSGIPFLVNRYRKRKVFAVAILVIAIFIFILTKFIWNIEVNGNEKISDEEIIEFVSEYGISIGKLKSNINTEKISNQIRLNRDDLAWIGIAIKGTNVIITLEEAIKAPEIIDKNEICDIVAIEDAIISKVVVQNGTSRVDVGTEVKKGDLLVEGIMEGTYSGVREVHAEADVFGKIYYEKERKEYFVQNEKIKTGNEVKKNEICINNFKINFNKRLLNFENYDTITSSKKIKLFSDFYLPIEIKTTTYVEYQNNQKNYDEEELKNKIENDLEKQMESEFQISKYEEKYIKKDVYTETHEDGITVKLVYEIQKEIGTKKQKSKTN